jgi:hypothetical protein
VFLWEGRKGSAQVVPLEVLFDLRIQFRKISKTSTIKYNGEKEMKNKMKRN